MMRTYIINVWPQQIEIIAQAGDNLYRLLAERGVLLDGDCGGRGTCRRCRVRIVGADPNDLHDIERETFTAEELREGWRLACLHQVFADCKVELAPLGQAELAIGQESFSDTDQLALAVDLGTTSVAAGLVALSNGAVLATASRANSQRSQGADVITRLGFALERPDGTQIMQRLVWQDIAVILQELCGAVGASLAQVSVITLVANSTMAHFVWGVSPRTLAMAPYEPAFVIGQQLPSTALPLADLLPEVEADVFLLPNIGGFLGSDTVAAAYACEMGKHRDDEKLTLLLDIGTNGELVLAGQGQLLAASAAAGPAFEGAHLSCGMRGEPGALQSACFVNGQLQFETVAEAPLVGICGSGLLSLVALLRREQVLDPRGRLRPSQSNWLRDRVCGEGAHKRFILNDQVFLSQEDVRQFQLAKGAIAACWQWLLQAAHAEESDLGQVVLAGMFGSRLNCEDAVLVGLLPDLPIDKIHHAGNAAWQGAYLAAVSPQVRAEQEQLARTIIYLNTAGSSEFAELFMKALML